MPPNHVMYPYFEYGEMPGYVRVKRVPAGYEVLGRTFPKEDAASGALAMRLAKILEVPKEKGPVPKLLMVLSGPVPRYVVEAFAAVFGHERVFVGDLDEPRALMSRYCALDGEPHWWRRVKKGSTVVENGDSPCGTGGKDEREIGDSPLKTANNLHDSDTICRNGGRYNGNSTCGIGDSLCGNGREMLDVGRGGGDPLTLRNITAKIGKGRNAVAISCIGDGKGIVECGLWSYAKRRVLKAEEELSRYKCRFTEANPDASLMQKRIFADVAASHVAYSCNDVNLADVSGLEVILPFIREYDALAVVDDLAAESPLVQCLVRHIGENRVFLPPKL